MTAAPLLPVAMLTLWCAGGASPLAAQQGSPDPFFASYPFERWFESGRQIPARWTLRASPVLLSAHQRLFTAITAEVDGADVVDRRGPGSLLIFLQVKDAQGLVYRDHAEFPLDKIQPGVERSNLTYSQPVFVRPGDYTVSAAIFDTKASEHGTRTMRLHVAPLRGDPLRDAWRALPAVEFVSADGPPDAWYLPGVQGKLHLPLDRDPPPRIDVLVNLSPSGREAGSFTAWKRNLYSLLPSLKALLQVGSGNVSFRVTLLDLAHQKVVFQQDDARDLDWPAVRQALTVAEPGKIDVKALQDRRRKAAFFVGETARILAAAPPATPRALVVLSGAGEFETGQDMEGVHLAKPPGCQVFYFRFWTVKATFPDRARSVGDPRGRRPGPPVFPPLVLDRLAGTLKPLSPRLFDIRAAAEFRKGLAALLHALSHR